MKIFKRRNDNKFYNEFDKEQRQNIIDLLVIYNANKSI